MTRFDKYLGYFILGPIAPLLFLIIGWWSSLSFVAEEYVRWYALAGWGLGCTLDLLFLPRWVARFYDLSPLAYMLIYFFYSIGVYGMFMGFPVINLVPGIAAGLYMGRRYLADPLKKRERILKRTSWFTTLVIAIVCCTTAWMAINEPTMPLELQGMLGLPFTVTWTMIYWLIGVGGILLIAVQYGLTLLAGKLAMRRGALLPA